MQIQAKQHLAGRPLSRPPSTPQEMDEPRSVGQFVLGVLFLIFTVWALASACFSLVTP